MYKMKDKRGDWLLASVWGSYKKYNKNSFPTPVCKNFRVHHARQYAYPKVQFNFPFFKISFVCFPK